ncbi:MAG: peptidylamidoglycolate lyase [Rhodothermales bacterium]|jgi:peptidylamidoglycolate lyase
MGIGHKKISRRALLGAAAGAVVSAPYIARANNAEVLGQGDFRYRQVPGWGQLGAEAPVKNCNGIVCTRDQHIVLLTDDTRNNVIVYDRAGKLVHKWGSTMKGAHGLSIVQEGQKEFLFIADNALGRVHKTTLDGTTLEEWEPPPYPQQYPKAGKGYRPSWTLHHQDGSFYVLDGYGRDYISKYDVAGKPVAIFGGQEGGIAHWGPHGGIVDGDTLLIAMSDQQYVLRLSLEGEKLARYPFPGGNPRQLRRFGDHYVMPHLSDNWPKQRSRPGYVSILDRELRIVSNIGGSAPEYGAAGLAKMRAVSEIFVHPHDAVADADGSLYVAQALSGNTYPIKLERV